MRCATSCVALCSVWCVELCVYVSFVLLTIGSAQLLLDGLARRLRQIGGLYVLLHADQRLLQGIERAGVQHLLLDLRLDD